MSVLATAKENGGAVGSSDGTGMDFDPSVTASHSHLGHMEGKEEERGGGEEVDKENKGHSKQRETNLSPELNRHESVVAADAQQQLHQQPSGLDDIDVVAIMTREEVDDERRPLLADVETSVKFVSSSSNNNVDEKLSAAPHDKFNFIYFVFFSLGLSTLLPWNFFISLNGFWDYKFRNVSGDGANKVPAWDDPSTSWIIHIPTDSDQPETELQQQFTSYLAIASNIPNALFVILNAVYGQKFSLNQRVSFALVGINIFFIVITVLSGVNSDDWQNTFLAIILVLVVLINVCGAIYQGAVLGAAAKFPTKYMTAAMTGQSVGGIFPVVVDIVVTSADIPDSDVGFTCFLIATSVLVVNLVLFYFSSKTTFFKFYIQDDRSSSNSAVRDGTTGGEGQSVLRRVGHATKKSWHYCAAIFVSFAVTLSVFPALTVNVQSQFKRRGHTSPWADKYFQLVGNFLLFNVGDLCGRTLAGLIKLPGRSKFGRLTVVVLSVLRIAFVPAFLLCNVLPGERPPDSIVFPLDSEFIVIMALFAVSNGYICSVCMIHGPAVPGATSEMQEEVALILTACLVSGIAVGSGLSYPILKLL